MRYNYNNSLHHLHYRTALMTCRSFAPFYYTSYFHKLEKGDKPSAYLPSVLKFILRYCPVLRLCQDASSDECHRAGTTALPAQAVISKAVTWALPVYHPAPKP